MIDDPDRDPRRRYALVGAGHRATTYLDALAGTHAGDGRPVALCDTNAARMRYHARRWSQARPADRPPTLYSDADFSVLLEREGPDTVIVTSVDSTHDRYIIEALERGCDVIVEKPLTTDAERCGRIVRAALRSDRQLRVAFNYRYSPRNAKVKELVEAGAIGSVTSAHFEWVLDTVHGADYFRRWHRDKASSGGLLVHKSSHHFDLVNWWLAAAPQRVFAMGALRFYGSAGAGARRPAADGEISQPPAVDAAFALDLAAAEHLRGLYLDAEHEDGYVRNRGVFDDGITIEDNIGVVVSYDSRAILTYSLNAHAPWEGYRVALNGTHGRLELDVCERAAVERGATARLLGGASTSGGESDPTAAEAPPPTRAERPPVREEGTRLLLQRHWAPAELIPVADGPGSHGGGDALLLDDLFRGDRADPLGQRAGYLDGARSMLVGAAANRCLEHGEPVAIADLGVPLETIARAASRRTARQEFDRLQSRSG